MGSSAVAPPPANCCSPPDKRQQTRGACPDPGIQLPGFCHAANIYSKQFIWETQFIPIFSAARSAQPPLTPPSLSSSWLRRSVTLLHLIRKHWRQLRDALLWGKIRLKCAIEMETVAGTVMLSGPAPPRTAYHGRTTHVHHLGLTIKQKFQSWQDGFSTLKTTTYQSGYIIIKITLI